jgi:hypothetical protein
MKIHLSNLRLKEMKRPKEEKETRSKGSNEPAVAKDDVSSNLQFFGNKTTVHALWRFKITASFLEAYIYLTKTDKSNKTTWITMGGKFTSINTGTCL